MTIAEKIIRAKEDYESVFNTGYDKGYINGENNGYTHGLEEGKEIGKEEVENDFWEEFQKGGKRLDYNYAFASSPNRDNCYWHKGFTPKYPIHTGSGACEGVFIGFGGGSQVSGRDINFKEFIENNHIEFQNSSSSSVSWDGYIYIGERTFYGAANITYLPKLKLTTSFKEAFSRCSKLVTIEELNISSISTASNAFSGCTKLENILFTGELISNGLSFSGCNALSHTTLMSLIDVLADYSSTSTTRKATIGSTNLAKLTNEEKAIATNKGWTLS